MCIQITYICLGLYAYAYMYAYLCVCIHRYIHMYIISKDSKMSIPRPLLRNLGQTRFQKELPCELVLKQPGCPLQNQLSLYYLLRLNLVGRPHNPVESAQCVPLQFSTDVT